MQVSDDNTLSKLILLFVFDKMEVPMSENTIMDMCCSTNNWINQLECRPLLAQLIEAGFLCKINQSHGEELYAITPDGRLCLAHFFIRISSSLRESISEFVKNNRNKYRRKQDYITDYYKNVDNSYTVVLKITEPTATVLELKITVPSRHSAKWISKQWENKAAQVYATLYDMLVD
jgi:DNA-binding PadR family transcriptional regulator